MKLFFIKIFYSLFFICIGINVAGQTKFTVSATPLNAGKDEYITLSLTVANGTIVQKITPPPFTDFTIVSGPNTTTEQNSINGISSQYVSISYVLLSKKTGPINLPPATAVIDGRTYKSNAIAIVISNKSSKGSSSKNSVNSSLPSMLSAYDPFYEPEPETTFSDYILRKGENIQKKVNDNMQLKLQLNKSSCYVGEALLATYKLYTRLKSESNLSKNPSFNGFSVIEMMQQNDPSVFTNEKLNGKSYNVYTIRKAQLYPLQAGPIEVESATLDNKISFVKYSGNNGNNYNIDPNALVTESVALSTKPTIINVKPLPEAGKPEGFKGAVGNFTIDAVLQKDSFTTDETAKLFVTITGEGNMHLITLPDIKWPVNFEAFDAKISDNTDNKTVPISGSKTFEVPFTVDRTGNYEIPIITFSYFDPLTKSYKNSNTKLLHFTIIKGKQGSTVLNKTINEKNENVSFIDAVKQYKSILLLFIVGVLIASFVIRITKEKKVATKDESKNLAVVDQDKNNFEYDQENPLTKTEDCLFRNECNSFYRIINDEVKCFLAKRFNISIEDLNNKRLSIVMDKAGVGNTLILETQDLIKEIEWQLYTPFERDEELNTIYSKAQNIIQSLRTQTINTNQ